MRFFACSWTTVAELRFRFARPDDYPEIRELIRDGFPEEAAKKSQALEELPRESWYDPSHLIVGEGGGGGRLVSMMGLRRGELFCGGVSLNAVLAGMVCTRSELRGKGIGSRMLAHAARVMEEWGVEVSYLHTGPERWGFYVRNGYRKTVLCNSRLDVRRFPPGGESPPVREARSEDAPALDRIHREHFSTLTGAWSRDVNFWERRIAGREKLWLETSPRFFLAEAAYVAFTDRAVVELACARGEEGAALAPALALAARVFEETGKETLAFHLSPADPLWERLRSEGAKEEVKEKVVFIRAHDADAVREKAGPERALPGLDASDLAALLFNGRRLEGLIEEGAVKPEDAPRLRELFPETGAARPLMDGY